MSTIMSTMLFSCTGYNKLGVRLFLLVPPERGNLGNPIEQYSKEKSLAKAIADVRTWLNICSDEQKVEPYQVGILEARLAALRQLVEDMENIPEDQSLSPQVQEAEALAGEIETKLPLMKFQAAINDVRTWLNICSDEQKVEPYQVGILEARLAALRQLVEGIKRNTPEGQQLPPQVQEAEALAGEIETKLPLMRFQAATKDARFWFEVCLREDVQPDKINILEARLAALRQLVEGIKRNTPEGQQLPPQVQDAEALAGEITTKLPLMRFQAAINDARYWLKVCSGENVQPYHVGVLLDSLNNLTLVLKCTESALGGQPVSEEIQKEIQEAIQEAIRKGIQEAVLEEIQKAIQEAKHLVAEIQNKLG